jgi:hypothetical protein
VLLLLDKHPYVEMRLLNPLGRAGSKWLNFAGDFQRANRRMLWTERSYSLSIRSYRSHSRIPPNIPRRAG